jgi:hypothetical protein
MSGWMYSVGVLIGLIVCWVLSAQRCLYVMLLQCEYGRWIALLIYPGLLLYSSRGP